MLGMAAADRSSNQAQKKVRLRDLTAITLHANKKTNARRSSPIPQLECIGGDACGDFKPRVVQCQNAGFDGYDVQWTCTSELPSNIEFGDIEVSCEGFDFPEDPYILVNSCGLEYTLYYKDSPKPKVDYNDQRYFPTSQSKCVLLTVLWRIVQSCMGRRGGGGGHPFSGSPWFGGNDDNSGGGPPPAKGYRSYQPSTGVAGMSPGFWAGLGLGGLGAYMMNRPRQERTTHRLVKTT
ncbi:unnamed protein product [Umbelopsis vinacea]